ncbi:MAG: ornithine cyclodeaminase family protein [Roseburia sp.]
MSTLLLNGREVNELLSIEDIVEAVKEGYKAFNQGKVVLPPIVSIETSNGGEVDFKSGYSQQEEIIGIKMAGGFWDNPKKYNLPSAIAMICLYDGENGIPVCIMDGTQITAYRTAAAGTIGALCLARKDSKKVAIIGTGAQARMQLRSLVRFFDIEEVNVYGIEGVETYIEDMSAMMPEIKFEGFENAKDAVADADIIVTVTASRQPLVMKEWVKPGTHINAIGCDMEGKQELDAELFRGAKVVNDCKVECMKRGDTQHPTKAGIVTADDIAEIGEILLGEKEGRTCEDEITIFDATGISVQDINSALYIYRKAIARNMGQKIEVI